VAGIVAVALVALPVYGVVQVMGSDSGASLPMARGAHPPVPRASFGRGPRVPPATPTAKTHHPLQPPTHPADRQRTQSVHREIQDPKKDKIRVAEVRVAASVGVAVVALLACGVVQVGGCEER
jgi:hypothetical protein